MNKDDTEKSNILSKKWAAFIIFILILSFIETLAVVATRIIPDRYSDINT